jgi:hypothetical protein
MRISDDEAYCEAEQKSDIAASICDSFANKPAQTPSTKQTGLSSAFGDSKIKV